MDNSETDLVCLEELSIALSDLFGTSIDKVHCTRLGQKIRDRNRREFPSIKHSPVHLAMKLPEDRREDALEVLIEKLNFRVDSVVNDEKYKNYTPAHMIATYGGGNIPSKGDLLQQILKYKPDLDIVANFRNEENKTCTGNVYQVAKKFMDKSEIIALEFFDSKEEIWLKLNELTREKEKWQAKKLTSMKSNKNKDMELEKIKEEAFETTHNLNLKISEAELEIAIEIQEGIKEYKQRTKEHLTNIADITEKLEVFKKRKDFETDDDDEIYYPIVELKRKGNKIQEINERLVSMPRKNILSLFSQSTLATQRYSSKKPRRNEKVFKTLLKINNHEEHELENTKKETNGINNNHLLNLKKSRAKLERAIEIKKKKMENNQKIRKNKTELKRKLQEYEIKVADITEKLEVLKRRSDFKMDEEINDLKEKIISSKKRKFGNEVENRQIFHDVPAEKVKIRN